MQHVRSDQLDCQATPDATLFGPAKSSSIPFDLSRRLGLSALRSCVDVMLGVVSTMALRAQLTAALTKEHDGTPWWLSLAVFSSRSSLAAARCRRSPECRPWSHR